MSYLFQKSLLIICCVVLFNVNHAFSQTMTLESLKSAVEGELKNIFSHNSSTKQYQIYSVKIDDAKEETDFYKVTGSFKFKNNTGTISTNIRFEAQARQVLNKITISNLMVNFDDVINSWQNSENVSNNKEDDNPLSLDKIQEKLIEKCLTLSYVMSVESLSISDYNTSSKRVSGNVKYKKQDGSYGSFSFYGYMGATEDGCFVSSFKH
jgi:hypothetical protein